jgi:hypothetical protein
MTIYRVIKSTEKCKCLLTVMQPMLQENGDNYNKNQFISWPQINSSVKHLKVDFRTYVTYALTNTLFLIIL